jgi:hypothetical protein
VLHTASCERLDVHGNFTGPGSSGGMLCVVDGKGLLNFVGFHERSATVGSALFNQAVMIPNLVSVVAGFQSPTSSLVADSDGACCKHTVKMAYNTHSGLQLFPTLITLPSEQEWLEFIRQSKVSAVFWS